MSRQTEAPLSRAERSAAADGRSDGRAASFWLTIRSGEARGKSAAVEGESFVVGRDAGCDLVLDDSRVSRRHASLKLLPDGRAELRDLGSGNGTFVNGRRVESELLQGDEQLQLGDTVLATSRQAPSAAGGATVIGRAPPERSQSAVYRLVMQRSVRRATLLSGAAIAIATVVSVLFATGVLPPGDGGSSAPVERVVKAAEPSTVLIERVGAPTPGGSGSGWVLDARAGLIVTNAHVVEGGQTFSVGLRGRRRDAKLVALAPCEDLAVLRVADTSGLRSLPLGSQSDLNLGEPVVAVGYPRNASLSASLTSTTGVVSVVRSTYKEPALDVPRYPNVVQTDAAINPGNSGGPLLDLEGRLIGVTSAGRTVSRDGRIVQGQNYAIGVDRVKEVSGVLRSGRSIGWTGLSFEYPTSEELEGRGLPPGLVVRAVVPGTGASAAGVREGDVVVAANGRSVDNTLASLCDALGGARSGQAVTLSLLQRGGPGSRDVRLTLG